MEFDLSSVLLQILPILGIVFSAAVALRALPFESVRQTSSQSGAPLCASRMLWATFSLSIVTVYFARFFPGYVALLPCEFHPTPAALCGSTLSHSTALSWTLPFLGLLAIIALVLVGLRNPLSDVNTSQR